MSRATSSVPVCLKWLLAAALLGQPASALGEEAGPEAPASDSHGPDAAASAGSMDQESHPTEIGRIKKVSGPVELIRNGGLVPVREQFGIRPGDLFHVFPQGQLVLSFFDDGEIELAPSTRIRLLASPDPPDCQGRLHVVATVHLEQGALWIVHEHDSSRPGIAAVKTDSAVICMLGTRVAVSADFRGTTQVQVKEGSVEVRSVDRERRRTQIVHKAFQTVVDKGRAPAPPYPWGDRHLETEESVLAILVNLLGPILDSPLLEPIDPGGITGRR